MLTAIDQVANRNHLQLIKAVLPYMPAQNQRTLCVLIKMLELRNVMRFYESQPAGVSACESRQEPPDTVEMLSGIRDYCEEEDQAMIDQWIQILSTVELYSMFAQSGGMDGFSMPQGSPFAPGADFTAQECSTAGAEQDGQPSHGADLFAQE